MTGRSTWTLLLGVALVGARLIQSFGVERYGAPLFFPNADAWRAKRPSG